jgi:hypothetical protein
VTLPVGYTVFPDELLQAPRHWVKSAYRNLIYCNVAKGRALRGLGRAGALRGRDASRIQVAALIGSSWAARASARRSQPADAGSTVWTAGGIVVNHAIVVYLAYLVPSRVRPSG